MGSVDSVDSVGAGVDAEAVEGAGEVEELEAGAIWG